MGVGGGPIIEFDKYFQPLRLPLLCLSLLELVFFLTGGGTVLERCMLGCIYGEKCQLLMLLICMSTA